MARFAIKITKDDGTVIDDVFAEFPDTAIPLMIASYEALGYTDSNGNLIVGGRSVTYGIRMFIEQKLIAYGTQKAVSDASTAAENQIKSVLSQTVINNVS